MGSNTNDLSLEERKAEAESRKAEAEAKEAEIKVQQAEQIQSNALLKAVTPAYTTQGLEGNISISGNLMVVNTLAMLALEECAKTMVDEIHDTIKDNKATFVLYSESTQRALFQLAELKQTLEQLIDTYEKYEGQSFEEPPTPEARTRAEATLPVVGSIAGIIELARGLLGSVANIASLFKVDRQFTEQEVTVSEEAIVVSLQQALSKYNQINRTTYALVDPSFTLPPDVENSELSSMVQRLKQLVWQLENKLPSGEQEDKTLNGQWATLNKISQELLAELGTKSTEGISSLALLMTMETIQHHIKNEHTYLLRITQEKPGGHVVASKGRLGLSKLMANGGVILSYRLMDNQGKVLTGNLVKAERSQRVV